MKFLIIILFTFAVVVCAYGQEKDGHGLSNENKVLTEKLEKAVNEAAKHKLINKKLFEMIGLATRGDHTLAFDVLAREMDRHVTRGGTLLIGSKENIYLNNASCLRALHQVLHPVGVDYDYGSDFDEDDREDFYEIRKEKFANYKAAYESITNSKIAFVERK